LGATEPSPGRARFVGPGGAGRVNAPFAAVVTAGGQSRRFGQDKALYVHEGRTLLDRVTDSLAAGAPRLLVAPEERYARVGWTTVPDLRPGLGPLAGLESALTWLGPEPRWVAFAAVDLPNLTPDFWAQLAGRAAPDVDAVIGVDGEGRDQPLAALYHTRLLGRVRALLDADERRLSALLTPARSERVGWSELRRHGEAVFLNANRPDDLSPGSDPRS
jgi:molybdopterin-guanine dinucleotide biosynthesis protein A